MRKTILLLGMLISSTLIFAQQTYTVKVTDSKTGNAISNASATVKSTRKGATSNSDGILKIQAKEKDVLEITSIGYSAKLVTLGTGTDISVALEPSSLDLGDVVVLGSRGAPRAKTETAVPVDVIKVNQVGLPTAKTDLTSVLNMAAPSFNYNKQSGADGADHMDLGTLRGLGPDQTLVLINGKRRHTTAFVALFGTRGRGASGADLNSFPEASVDRLEILRDGASAQYGSDAIAGVINIILKKDVNHLSINGGWSGYYDDKFNSSYQFKNSNQYYYSHPIDGGTFNASLNHGFSIGKRGGFFNYSLDFLTQAKTFRQVDTANWQHDRNALPYINTSRRAFGDGSVKTGGAMFNMEVPLCKKGSTSFYSFGGYNYKASDAYAYTRNLSSNPNRFPVDANGATIFDPEIMHKTTDGEIYYNPHIQTHIQDISLATGVKGIAKGWNWDLSNTFGKNDFHYYGDKTFNASLITVNNTPPQIHFDDGGFNFIQNTANLDFSKSFANIASGFNLGLGAEYRYERYSIYKGEFGSYDSYTKHNIYYQNTGDSATPATGSQGFPGFSPHDVITANRSNFALYVDGELNVTKKWLVDGAVRFENYTDFGSVATYKFATRYKIARNFNVRGSVSTGFRAPSLQQINFSNTLTSFSNNELVQSLIARNGSAISKAAGISNLKQEKSLNASVGFSWKPIQGLTVTVDGYMVKVKDRIVLSGLFSRDDATLPQAFRDLIPDSVATVQFFANAVNTTNYGVDVVIDYTKKWNKNKFTALLAGNIQDMKLDAIHVPSALNGTVINQKTFYSDREVAFLKASAPKQKVSLSLEFDHKRFGIGTHINYWGKITLLGFGVSTDVNPNSTGIDPQVPNDIDGSLVPEHFNYNAKITTDAFVSYKIAKQFTVFFGADNIFNIHPNLGVNQQAKGYSSDNESGGPWDSVQMGFNGRRLFGKIALNF
ncbi:MAG: TonB-dependent receptor [Ferruginibacter sp.]